MPHADLYTRLILDEIDAGRACSQRRLAGQLGIALGRANSLIRALVDTGWVVTRPVHDGVGRYELTSAGRLELTNLTRQHLDETVAAYAATRQRLVRVLAGVSKACEVTGGTKRVAFYGAGDVAEIGYAALQHTDLTLVGIIDDERRGAFFEHTIQPRQQLHGDTVAGVAFDRLIMMSINPEPGVAARLRKHAVPRERVCWL
jgi:DNA-binding MarR family transcriptional regulator